MKKKIKEEKKKYFEGEAHNNLFNGHIFVCFEREEGTFVNNIFVFIKYKQKDKETIIKNQI